MIRVCPHSDSVCRNGMACTFSCATGDYDGTKRPTAPSNANPSGLEVVAWRWRFRPDAVWNYQEAPQHIPDVTCEPLVTAASAQAAIDAEREQFGQWLVDAANARDAAEARADRMAKGMKMLGGERPEQKRKYPNSYRGGFDAATDLAASIARAALQQEG